MNNIVINKSTNEDKKELKRFYKTNHYPVSFIGHDHVYKVIYDSKIIGSGIISYIDKSNDLGLLHALLISEENRGKGHAKRLIQHISNDHKHIVCFADKKLKSLYNSVDFYEQQSTNLPDLLKNKYNSYLKKNKSLIVFTHNM